MMISGPRPDPFVRPRVVRVDPDTTIPHCSYVAISGGGPLCSGSNNEDYCTCI